MALREKNTLKSWFLRGAKPLANQFADWIDSYWHKSEKISMTSVENLAETLNSKAEKALMQQMVSEHNADTNSHEDIRQQITDHADDETAHNSVILSKINAHNTDANAHGDIRQQMLSEHNANNTAHEDIKRQIKDHEDDKNAHNSVILSQINTHNTDANTHEDIRQLIQSAGSSEISYFEMPVDLGVPGNRNIVFEDINVINGKQYGVIYIEPFAYTSSNLGDITLSLKKFDNNLPKGSILSIVIGAKGTGSVAVNIETAHCLVDGDCGRTLVLNRTESYVFYVITMMKTGRMPVVNIARYEQ